MVHKGIRYEFSATPWKINEPSAWYFISLPIPIAKEIREQLKSEEEGWGRLKTKVKIGKTAWETSIWFDTKFNTYLLPLKAEVRKSENIEIGKLLTTYIWV